MESCIWKRPETFPLSSKHPLYPVLQLNLTVWLCFRPCLSDCLSSTVLLQSYSPLQPTIRPARFQMNVIVSPSLSFPPVHDCWFHILAISSSQDRTLSFISLTWQGSACQDFFDQRVYVSCICFEDFSSSKFSFASEAIQFGTQSPS